MFRQSEKMLTSGEWRKHLRRYYCFVILMLALCVCLLLLAMIVYDDETKGSKTLKTIQRKMRCGRISGKVFYKKNPHDKMQKV